METLEADESTGINFIIGSASMLSIKKDTLELCGVNGFNSIVDEG
jgi:hypothetical protein